MTSIRLVAIALLFGSPALAQISTQGTSGLANASSVGEAAPTTIAETWRIPERLPAAIATDAVVAPLAGNLDKGISISPTGDSSDDHSCFMIRSYVVARDSKYSEATHFVRSSTCQPARRYGLKTTVAQPSTPAR
jgi:hypothetical protein